MTDEPDLPVLSRPLGQVLQLPCCRNAELRSDRSRHGLCEHQGGGPLKTTRPFCNASQTLKCSSFGPNNCISVLYAATVYIVSCHREENRRHQMQDCDIPQMTDSGQMTNFLSANAAPYPPPYMAHGHYVCGYSTCMHARVLQKNPGKRDYGLWHS